MDGGADGGEMGEAEEEELLLAPDPSEEDALMASAELAKEDEERLLGGDDEVTEDLEVPEESADQPVEAEETSESDEKSSEETKETIPEVLEHSQRHLSLFRGRGRFLRGPMRLMPPPGRFFPVPFGPRPPPPPFYRYPMGFRCPPRHPMMRGIMPGPPLMPPHMLGEPHFPPGRPFPLGSGHRGRSLSLGNPRRPTPATSSGQSAHSTSSSSSSATPPVSGPKPLMSIETPAPVKAMVNQKIQMERATELAKRQNLHQQRQQRLAQTRAVSSGIKRPIHSDQYGSSGGGSGGGGGGGSGGGGGGEPASKYPAHGTSTVVRSNLRQIQCVDEPMPADPLTTLDRRQGPPSYRSTSLSSSPQLSHNPCPTRITIDTSGRQPAQRVAAPPRQPQFLANPNVNGNLVTIPLVDDEPRASNGGQGPQSSQPSRMTNKVLISNLPASVTFDRVSQMTTACGNVKTIQIDGNRAIVEFVDFAGADKFLKLNNRKMMDLSILTVTRIM